MKEAQIWQKIHMPKVEQLISNIDKNGKRYIITIINPKDTPKLKRKQKPKR